MQVYLVRDEALVCEVALKSVVPNLAGDSHSVTRLRDEVRLAQKVTHPNVCRTYDLEEIDGNWLIKMEYVAGETLTRRLERGRLAADEAVGIARQVCAGLAAAHGQGVVHRDLKPHNIMIEEKTGRVVIMDFGIARAAALAGKTAENVSGTPEYMAPEQVRGREVDGRADLYSLGCVLDEMLVGERVFPGTTAMAAALAHADDPAPAVPVFCSTRGAQSHLFEMSLDGATEPVQLTFGQGWKFNPDVSPDGRSVLYDVDVTSVQLFAQPMGGGPARKLASNLLDLKSPQPTPDGRAIIAAALLPSLRSQIVSIPLDGGDPTPLVEGETPALTPDAREIVYSDRRSGRVMAIPRAGGASRLVTEAPGPLVHLQMGPEGRIYMMVSRPQGGEAWSAPLASGPAERALPAPWNELVPARRGGWRAAVQWLELPKYRVRFLARGTGRGWPAHPAISARRRSDRQVRSSVPRRFVGGKTAWAAAPCARVSCHAKGTGLPLTIGDMSEFRKQTISVRRVFYSWQSDLPNATNRGLIGDALEAALTELASVRTTAVEAAPDRDTQGVAGAPDIAATIFEKIAAAAVFVADISLVTPPGAGRAAPNPNVLIELGYAMRALGPSRIILVFNEHFGRVEQLPFDLRARRVLTYTNDPEVAERAVARRSLTGSLKTAVASCLDEAETAMAAQPSIRIELSRVAELGKPDSDLLKTIVQNHGHQPLFISSITFEWGTNGGLSTERDVTGRINSGGKIEPGDSYDWIVPVDVLKLSEAERQQPFETVAVHDRLGNVHRSPPGELRRVLDS